MEDTGTADDVVDVPAMVGLTAPRARNVALAAGVALTEGDPDGPPLPPSTWPTVWYVTGQRPVAGQRVRRWSTVAVWFEKRRGGDGGGDGGGGEGGDREPRRPRPDPGVLTATADTSVTAG